MKTHIYSYINGTSTNNTDAGSKVGDASNQSRCLKKLCQVSRWISPGVWKALCWFVLDWLMSVRKWVNPGVSASPPVVSHFGPESTSPFVSKAKCWFTSGRKNQFRCLYKPCVDSFRAGLKKTSVARFRVGPEENQTRRRSHATSWTWIVSLLLMLTWTWTNGHSYTNNNGSVWFISELDINISMNTTITINVWMNINDHKKKQYERLTSGQEWTNVAPQGLWRHLDWFIPGPPCQVA